MSDTLVVGLGGVGVATCRRLIERLQGLGGRDFGGEIDLLLMDTDRTVLGAEGDRALFLTASAAVLDAAYRNPERFQSEWLNPEVLRGRRSIESGTQCSRGLGRFLLLLPENRELVRDKLASWFRARRGSPAQTAGCVYVVASCAGGTGGGQICDLGYLIQDVAATCGASVDLRALLITPSHHRGAQSVAAFATLTELHYFCDPHTRYRAALSSDASLVETRLPPYRRILLQTSLTTDGTEIPLPELQEQAGVYLLAVTEGDTGVWGGERARREAETHWLDSDANPQPFTTMGISWLEFPEERLASAVYRNLVRRSVYPWLQGDVPISASELTAGAPMADSEAMATMMVDAVGGPQAQEEYLRPVRTRLPWLPRGTAGQWKAMDQEIELSLRQTVGRAPAQGQPGQGPMAERFDTVRGELVAGLRRQCEVWLRRDGVSLERVARVLNELATELRTRTDPVAAWGEAWEASDLSRKRILWAVDAAGRDPFLLFFRRMAKRRLAAEYERTISQHIRNQFRSQSTPYLRELRAQVLEVVRTWAGRIGELGGLLARLSRSMADYESTLLERLRREEEDRRLILGALHLPGAETPYVANSGWNLPYCTAEEELGAIQDLKAGWLQVMVERPDGLLAEPGLSMVDSAVDDLREERLPWLIPPTFTPTLEGTEGRVRDVVMAVDRQLRMRVDARLRQWIAAGAYQRLLEQYRDPVEQEFQIRRLLGLALDLPTIEPMHARPSGFPQEHAFVLLGEPASAGVPPVLQMVVGAAGRDRPVMVAPSKLSRYLMAVSEHPGFSLPRCPVYFALAETFRQARDKGMDPTLHAYSRLDVPWVSAGLTTHTAIRDASNILILAVAFGIVRPLPSGEIPIPAGILQLGDGAPRFPLPAEFDLGVRQLAGDATTLKSLGTAVDRTLQSRGAEWCCLQLERLLAQVGGIPVFGGDGVGQRRARRLAGLRAAARYEDLFDEVARTPLSRDTEWLWAGSSHHCPACATDLGADPKTLPGLCPRCREPLLPHLVREVQVSDGFRRIPNPYVVGTPLESGASVFVGREDIISQVRDRLIRPAQRTILILIGERRSGKTSALKQLQYRLEGDLTPLFIDMQGLTASDLGGFIWWLSWRMKEALDERGISVTLPSFEQFNSGPPDFQFETVILPEIRRKLHGGRILLMLDEFEVLAQRVMKGSFDSRAFDYLRHLMQHGDGVEFLFAGTHVLRQFAANYVTFLFNIGVFLHVDFLTRDAATRLATDPIANAGVSYQPDAIDSLLELGGCHAYFTQMFCFHLVERLNRLRKREITRQDVEMESGPVIQAAGAHLDHVWSQLESPDRLLIAFFAVNCPRGVWLSEAELLNRAIADDSSLRPFVFRTSVEKLIAVGLLRARATVDPEGRAGRELALTAEVYRQWLETQHSFSRLREEGVTWN